MSTSGDEPGGPVELRVGIDIGGTFTDLCVLGPDGVVAVGKTLTTHGEPARGVEHGLRDTFEREGLDPAHITTVVHGTTLVTNALIERRGARTAMVTTEGFRDVVEMGREHRYELYDLDLELPRPLVPRHRRLPVTERTLADGTIDRPLDREHLARLGRELVDAGIEAVAVCFLHSHTNPANERAAREVLHDVVPGLRVALSSDINPEIREYERFSTTCANVYVQDVVETYLRDLTERLRAWGVGRAPLIMLSNGGLATVEVAAARPIRMLESGPAGGALGAVAFAREQHLDDLLAFDMGGTTAKLCIIEDGAPLVTHAFEVDRVYRMRPGSGLPVRSPVIDMIEIGAGGGSVASTDSLGLVTVGPRSQGSEPGPACYGLGGDLATVTDADVVLGYLAPSSFLGGRMSLDHDRAVEAVRRWVAEPMGISVEQAAYGIHATVNENMANAARVHAVERGKDASSLPMFVSGGNGPLHGPGVAEALGTDTLIVPPVAGVLSALGFLAAPMTTDTVRSHHAPLDQLGAAEAREIFAALRQEAGDVLESSGVAPEDLTYDHVLDMRFVGQGAELRVQVRADADPWHEHVRRRFLDDYATRFSKSAPSGVALEILTWRVTARGPEPDPRLSPTTPAHDGVAGGERPVWFPATGWTTADVHERSRLAAGTVVTGPALVEEHESTLLVPPGAVCEVRPGSTIVVRLGGAA